MTPLHPLGVSRSLVVCVRGLRSAFGRGSENLGARGSGNLTDRGLRFGLFRFGLEGEVGVEVEWPGRVLTVFRPFWSPLEVWVFVGVWPNFSVLQCFFFVGDTIFQIF